MDEIGQIEKASIAPKEMEEVRKTEPIIILRDKGRCIASMNLLVRESAYDTIRTQNVLPIYPIKTTKWEMNTWMMININTTPVEEPLR